MGFSDKIDYYETYNGQKELEQIVLSRKLIKPKTNSIHIVLLFVLLVFICFFFHFVLHFISLKIYLYIIVSISFYIVLFETYMRFYLIQIVKCYQHYAKEETRRRCLCIPSCSEFAILTIKKYPLLKSLLKIRKRLLKTCKGEMFLKDYP